MVFHSKSARIEGVRRPKIPDTSPTIRPERPSNRRTRNAIRARVSLPLESRRESTAGSGAPGPASAAIELPAVRTGILRETPIRLGHAQIPDVSDLDLARVAHVGWQTGGQRQ